MIWTKRDHQRAKFQTFDCSRENSPNLYFDRLLSLKVYKISANKVQVQVQAGVMSHGTEWRCQKPLSCFKNDKSLVNFDPSTQTS